MTRIRTSPILLSLLLLLLSLNLSSPQSPPGTTTTTPLHASAAAAAASFALTELQKLSDSGIYETLTLEEVQSATPETSTFHDCIRLSLALSSPHFKSNQTTENFEVLVMTSKSDKSKSFAIDKFPEMDPLAVEEFWVKKAKAKKAERQELYAQLKSSADVLLTQHNDYVAKASELSDLQGYPLNALTNAEMLKLIDDTKGEGETARAAKALLQERYFLHSSEFQNASPQYLRRIASSSSADPIKQKVALRLLQQQQQLNTKEEL